MRSLVRWLFDPPLPRGVLVRSFLARLRSMLCPWLWLPVRVRPGFWWIARDDAVSVMLLSGRFEAAERDFVARVLKPGATFVDVGANAGLFTLLASRLVGRSGRVVAFEPSPRELQRLSAHLWLNRCRNVQVEACAVGRVDGDAVLHVVTGIETGMNSLRTIGGLATTEVSVRVRSLDAYLLHAGLTSVDLVKLDVEGGEVEALRGAESVFRTLTPALLCEISAGHLAHWGYTPADVLGLLEDWGYRWFDLGEGGVLLPLADRGMLGSRNVVALPSGRRSF